MVFLRRHPSQGIFGFRSYPKDPVAWFESVVADSNLLLWKPGDSICGAGVRLLTGIATWSGYDLEFLDEVDGFFAQNARRGVRFDVFPVDEIKDPSEFGQYYPVDLEVIDTPVVGKWVDGAYEEAATGNVAKELVRKTLQRSLEDLR